MNLRSMLFVLQLLTLVSIAIGFNQLAAGILLVSMLVGLWMGANWMRTIEQLVRERNDILDNRPHLPLFVVAAFDWASKGKKVRIPKSENKNDPRFIWVGHEVPGYNGKPRFLVEFEVNESGVHDIPDRLGE